VHPISKRHFQVIAGLEEHLEGVDIWENPSHLGRSGRIMVPLHQRAIFHSLMENNGINYDVLIEDVKLLVRNR
jgi:hypothetical protein